MTQTDNIKLNWLNYQINEGSIRLAEGFSDESMQIIKYPSRQLTFVITRAQLQKDQTIEAYVNEQVAQMRMGMKAFQVTTRQVISLGGLYQGEHLECHLLQGNQPIFNHLIVVARENQLLAMTFAQPKLFNETDLEFINTILESFIPVQ